MPPFVYETKKRYLSRMSFCNGDTSCNIVLSIWDGCSLIHHLPAADDDYLSLAGRAKSTASASKFFHNEYRRNPFILVWLLCVNYTNRTNNRVLNLDVIVVSIWLL